MKSFHSVNKLAIYLPILLASNLLGAAEQSPAGTSGQAASSVGALSLREQCIKALVSNPVALAQSLEGLHRLAEIQGSKIATELPAASIKSGLRTRGIVSSKFVMLILK